MSATNSFIPGSSGKAAGSNIPIAHLDYSYVKDCTKAEELEEIIRVLRSGSEGYYPDLLDFTENKLKEINPKSEVLRKEKSALRVHELSEHDKAMADEFLKWMNDANDREKRSNGQADVVMNVDGLPPVRSAKTIVDNGHKENAAKSNISNLKKTVKPRDYQEWDKFDVDKELENLEKKQEAPKPSANPNKNTVKIESVTSNNLDANERLFRATKEKEKGNEAFKVKAYDEAIVYYTNSLKYEPTAASYNNRAAAELKIEKYTEAIEDCNKVLDLEPNNIKAFLRRGMGYKALKNYELAVENFESMLRIDPNNKRAKELLSDVELTMRVREVTKVEGKSAEPNSDVIHEAESSDNAGAKTKRKGQRLKIVEIEGGNDATEKDNIEPAALESGSHQNNENGQPVQNGLSDQVGKSKGILEDINMINGAKHGMPMDNMMNSEPLENSDLGEVNKSGAEIGVERCLATESEAGLKEFAAGNNVGRYMATESEAEFKNEPSELSCQDSPSSAEDERFKNPEPEQNEKESILEIPENVKSFMTEGNDLYKMGRHSEALEKYSKCVKYLWADRESYASAVSSFLNNKAACYMKMGNCTQCVLECNKSLKLIDNNVKALIRRGTAYETMEKYVEAFKDFNRVRLIDVSNKIAQQHCSRVIKHLEMQHGKSWRKKILETSDDDDSKQKTFLDKKAKQAQGNMSKEDENAKPSQKASLQPESSLNTSKKEPEIGAMDEGKEESEANIKARFLKLKDSGNVLVRKGKHEEALKQYNGCITLCPNEVAIYTNRALCYLRLNKYDLAEDDCNTALKMEADNIKALFRRGKARKGLGRYRDASNDLIQVLKLDSKNGPARVEFMEIVDLLKKEKQDVGSKGVEKIDEEKKDGEKKDEGKKAEEKKVNVKKDEEKKFNEKKDDEEKVKEKKDDGEKVKEKKDGEKKNGEKKAVPKRKKILIQDIDGEDDKKLNQTTREQDGASVAKNNESPAVVQKNNKPKEAFAETNAEKQSMKTKHPSSQKESTKTKKESTKTEEKTTKEGCSIVNAKNSTTAPVKYTVKSAYQFLQAWKSVKKNDTAEYLNILKQVTLTDFPTVISNKLDGDMIKSILEALSLEMQGNGDVKFVYQFLQQLVLVERLDMTLMFLSSPEKKMLQKLFEDIANENNDQTGINIKDLSQLKQKYQR